MGLQYSSNRRKQLSTGNRRLQVEQLEMRRVLAASIGANLWVDLDDNLVADSDVRTRATEFNLFSLESTSIAQLLQQAPLEFTQPSSNLPSIQLPRADGTFESFTLTASPIMAPELAAKFPEITTYAGQGIDNPAASVRLDFSPQGLHAQVLSPEGAYYIDPAIPGTDTYLVYDNSTPFDLSDLGDLGADEVIEHSEDHSSAASRGGEGDGSGSTLAPMASRSGSQLRTYRTAVAATGEYTAFHGGTVASGMAAIVTAMNRVTGVYETELAIRFQLVANNDQLVFTNAATDPYTNNSGGAMLGENQTTVDSIIGNANYDIGHVFSTGGGGVALLGSVGIDGIKAQGVTGLPAPTGDAFYIDYVSHEVGHQFGGNHTFNANTGSCAGNANASTAMEPGSGSTIQAYAGICGTNDLQSNSDPYFHSVSFDEMIRHVDVVIPTVGTRLFTGNNIPVVNAGNDFSIPARTPFVLTADGSDQDGNASLTYNWEQRDTGPLSDVAAGDNGSSPIFRSWLATPEPERYFPRLSDLVNNTTAFGETLPTSNRNLNFRVTVRDNRIGGGGVNTDDMQLTVVDTGAPFEVLTPGPATVWTGLDPQTVTWNVAGTNNAPISTPEVSLFLSVDGGLTYPYTLATQVPNSGSANIFVPNVDSTQARVMVKAHNNVFFDINNEDITINAIPLDVDISPASVGYIENQAPVAVAATSQVLLANNLAGLSLNVTISNGRQTGDILSMLGSNGISVAGNSLLYNSTPIASYNKPAADRLAIRFNSQATIPGAEAVLQNVAFSNSTDNPGNSTRTIEFVLGGSFVRTVEVFVTPTNDPPVVSDARLPNILEDSPQITGATIGSILDPTFADPDAGASLSGIVVINNPENSTQGEWFYSTDRGTSWAPIGLVNDSSQSLVLSRDHLLGFLPAADFYGTPDALQIRALDEHYVGSFSDINLGLRIPYANQDPNTVSTQATLVDIEVINVNDLPVANLPSISINLLQDEAIDRAFEANYFTDIDSAPLSWSIVSANGAPVPSWLQFNPATLEISGTPRNQHVGNYQLQVRATDSFQASAAIPLNITVTNVNDAPTNLQLTGTVVPENRAGVFVGELFATDIDPGDLVTWSTSDSRFSVRDNQLFLQSPLDYETETTIPLTLRATDTGFPTAFADLNVVIKITDENEAFPLLVGGTLAVDNGTPAGTLLRTLNAPDADSRQTVKYRLRSGDASAFSLDAVTGELRLAETADRSVKSSYKVFIEAYDNGSPVKATTSQFIVTVNETNNFAPIIPPGQTLTFQENPAAGTVVGQIDASDPDGNAIQFSIESVQGGNVDWLSIDPTTGAITVQANADFNFESGITHAVTVRVDELVTPFHTATGTVQIQLIDVNEAPSSIGNLSVRTSQLGADGGTPVVEDQDPSPTGYSFTTSDPRFEFRNGQLSLRQSAYFENSLAGTSVSVPVQVMDNSDPTSIADLLVTVMLEANPAPWQNPIQALDVNRDGEISGLDTLQVVNALNSRGTGVLPTPRTYDELQSQFDIDPSGDNQLSAVDTLLIVNYINARAAGGEGENSSEPGLNDAGLWLSAFDQLQEEMAKRRTR